MSDTPRTDAAYAASTGAGIYELFKESQDIERELNAANQRIQSLIEERDRANRLADWKWNLRGEFESLLGTDKIEEGIEAVKELKRRIQRLEEESESDWNLAQSAIGSCAEMSSRIQRLEEAGDALKAAGYFGGWADAVNKWIKEKEDKP